MSRLGEAFGLRGGNWVGKRERRIVCGEGGLIGSGKKRGCC